MRLGKIHRMDKNSLKYISVLMLLMGLIYIIHKVSFSIFNVNTQKFSYSLEKLYIFFSAFSILILAILFKVKKRNLDIVGNLFLLLTTIKMIVSYIIARPILNLSGNDAIEKWNFFILFILFLGLETLFTIYLLNSKRQ